jgi:spore coat protein A
MNVSRRNVLTAGGLGALGLVGLTSPLGNVAETKSASSLPDRLMPRPFRSTFQQLPVLTPSASWRDGDGVDWKHFIVTAKPGYASLVPGVTTPVMGYNGVVPGQTISVEQGTRVKLTVRNQLPATGGHAGHEYQGFATSTHLHGHASLPEYDGYADDLTKVGFLKDYVYDNVQPARSIWYHDHARHVTGLSVYSGLAAQYLLHDQTERALLPQGDFDVPLTLNDMMFAADGTAAFDDKAHSGLWGDIVFVNGRPWPVMPVQRRVYRFRLLNASISRSYRPYLSTREPVTMVATDGGLMPQSRQVTSWRHAPAERYEFLVDFSRYAPGTQVRLLNASNPKNVDFDHTNKIMAFQVTDAPVDTTDPTWRTIPQTLASSSTMSLTAAQSVRRRHFRLRRDDQTNVWNIDNKTWDDVIDSDYQLVLADPGFEDVEMWDLETRSGGWFHPMHIHLVDFQILSRNGRAPFDYERGPKDTVYVGPDEIVRVLMKFEHHRGRYMVHCHNLPHEDHDMMAQFAVGWKPGEVDPHHPIETALPVPDTLPAHA